MNIKKRQKIGVALMAASVLAAILIQAFTGHVLQFHVTHTGFVPPNTISTDDFIVVYLRYDIPLAAAFVIGLVCCVWPTRKPPQVSSA
jgi:hypothetical protein